LLKNPFYCGLIKVKKNNQLYPHIYDRLITKDLFDKCQDVKNNRGKHKHKKTKIPFIFSGLVKCEYCDCTYSPDLKKGKYVYLKPSKKKGNCNYCKSIREEVALNQVRDILKQIQIPEDILLDIKQSLQNSLEAKKQFHNNYISKLQEENTRLQTKIDKLTNKFIEDSITKTDYDKYLTQFKTEQYNINKKLRVSIDADEKFSITLSTLLELASKSYQLFESSNQEEKRQIINLVCSNLKLNGEKLVFTMAKPFDSFIKVESLPKWLPLISIFRTEKREEVYSFIKNSYNNNIQQTRLVA